MAGLIAVLVGRLERLLDRARLLHGLSSDEPRNVELKAGIPRLKKRATLINSALFFAAASGLVTTLLIVMSFTYAFLNLEHERGVAVLFILAVGLFASALVQFMREIHLALEEIDYLG